MVYIASFADAVYSLLSDPELMKKENLSFPADPDDPFLSEPKIEPTHRAPTMDMSELHRGTWYTSTHNTCSTLHDVLCPVIAYIDGVSTGRPYLRLSQISPPNHHSQILFGLRSSHTHYIISSFLGNKQRLGYWNLMREVETTHAPFSRFGISSACTLLCSLATPTGRVGL